MDMQTGKLPPSLAGRLIIINSVTTAIPTHIIQCTLLPSRICMEIDKINHNFLWGNSTIKKKKINLLNWDAVTKPKFLGKLGIKKSLSCNKAFLARRA